MRSWNEICRAITAFSNPWTSKAFQVIVAIAVLIVPICCFEGVAYSLEFSASNPSFREAGVQNAVYQALVDEWGSPLRRLGAYDNAPFVMESEIVDAVWDLGAAATAYKNLGVRTVTYSSMAQKSGVILVTPQGVALPQSEKYRIPDSYVDNPYRSGSYGERINGRFIERVRIDPPTPPGKNGPSYSHYHLNGGHEHLSPRNRNDPGFSQ